MADLTLTRYGSDGTPLTADGTEQTIKELNPTGNLIAHRGILDASNMVTGDVITICEYYKIKSGGTYRKLDSHTISGAQTAHPAIDITPRMPNRFGAKITVQQTARGTGGYKSFDWELYTSE